MGEATASAAALVGRDREVALLRERLDAARAGQGNAVLVSGEPGVGKTALVAEALAAAPDALVLRCRGLEAEVELPFSGLHELLIPLLPAVTDLPGPQRAALERALGLDLTPSDEGSPVAVSLATLTLLSQAASDRTVALVVDDVHWLDEPTALILGFVARRLAHDSILLLMTSRTTDVRERILSEHVELGRLTIEATRELAQRQVERTMQDATVAAVADATGGNPLAVIETLRLLGDEVDRIGTTLDEPLPASALIERGFRARLGSLSDDANVVLVLIATALMDSATSLLAAIDRIGTGDEPLLEAERAGIIVRDLDTVTFSHPLLRSLVFHRATADVQRRCHQALSEAASDETTRLWHAASAATRADEALASELAATADDLMTRRGYVAAARTLERAARLTPNRLQRAERLYLAGLAARRTGRSAWTTAILDEAFALADARTPLRIRIENERIAHLGHTGSNGGLQQRWQQLADEAEGVDRDLYIDALASVVGEAYLVGGAGMEIGRQAIARLEPLGWPDDPALATNCKLTVGNFLLLSGDDFARGVALIREGGREAMDFQRYGAIGAANALLTIGDLKLAEQIIDVTLRHVRDSDDLHLLGGALCIQSVLLLHKGDWAAAELAAEQGVQIAESSKTTWQLAFALSHLALVRAGRGDETALTLAARANEMRARYELGNVTLFIADAAGLYALGVGDATRAVREFEIARDWSDLGGHREPCYQTWRWNLVEAYVLAGDDERAAAALEDLRTAARAADRPLAHALVARLDGVRARDDADAIAHLEHATALHADLGMVFEEARTRLHFGRRLRRAGEHPAALEQLTAARQTFERLGAAPWIAQTGAELAKSGAPTPATATATSVQLTAQEKVVADCVAQGMTNKEAAAHLFLTTKTIEWHLRQIYRKLGIRSRVQLAQHVAATSPRSATAEPAP